MEHSDVRERNGWPQAADWPAFDVTVSKLLRPMVRQAAIGRPALIQRLAASAGPVVSVVAPPGYGKTTLLSQWAELNSQRFAWVSVDEADNDPKVLLTYVAKALDAVEPIDGRVFAALAAAASSVPGSVVPRLGSAFSSMTTPVVLILDDVHLLANTECRAALSVLADHVPAGSRLVLAGRSEPPLRVARLRAEGRILEIGPRELSLDRAEAAALLRGAGVVLGAPDVAELHRRTEGWPTGLYLAALAIREGGSPASAAVSFGGHDRLVSDYLEAEVLARLSDGQRVFLTRTAVLDRMSGPLCEAVLGLRGSAAILEKLAQSNMLLVSLDRRGQWYRYHHLFRDMLLAQLQRQAPEQIPGLRRRAAGWCLDHDLPEAALEYSMAAGDVDTAARLLEKTWLPVYREGRVTTLERWIRWLDDHGGIEGHPQVAVWASILAAQTGRPADAERWADAVDRWQHALPRPADPHTEANAALLRALLCRHGVEQMRADAEAAVLGLRGLAAQNAAIPAAQALHGLASILCGDPDGGDAILDDAARIGDEVNAYDTLADTLCERSLLAMARDDWSRAGDFARRARAARRQAGIENLTVCAVHARLALHRRDIPAAREELVNAQRVRPLITYAMPHLAVQARIELARVHLALADLAGARTLMREIDEILKRRPGLGTLAGEALALRRQLAAERGPATPGASALTAAELRLLPLLSTHLSFPEIAAELFLSPHTVKSQATSIYRKLGASSRSQAVARSQELTLLQA
jgi:LuxR family transcriptional regulator, maltose regulon positive regulatory protein